jgi:hypothetical protein
LSELPRIERFGGELVNGSYRCHECGILTDDWHFIERRYWCDEHAAEGRKLRGRLASSRAMMGNQNAAKRSGNPARRNAKSNDPQVL